jgi:hypothetical protein
MRYRCVNEFKFDGVSNKITVEKGTVYKFASKHRNLIALLELDVKGINFLHIDKDILKNNFEEIGDDNFTYSFDGEIFIGNCYTKQDAVNEAKTEMRESEALHVGSGFYVGKVKDVEIPLVDAEMVIEQIQTDTFEQNKIQDDIPTNYLVNLPDDRIDELQQKLTKVFNEWAKKFEYYPDFHSVIDIEKYELRKDKWVKVDESEEE